MSLSGEVDNGLVQQCVRVVAADPLAFYVETNAAGQVATTDVNLVAVFERVTSADFVPANFA